MILGRPTNLWLGLTTAVVGALSVTAVVLGADPTIVATIGGAWGGVIGSVIALVSGQPPTLNPGDPYSVTTPKGSPNLSLAAPTTEAIEASPVALPPVPTVPDATSSQPAQDVNLDG